MQIIYSREPLPASFAKSLFLAGPTPREDSVPSWRPQALRLLQEMGYDGVVFVPEDRDGSRHFEYDDQVRWEEEALRHADQIVFWIPRKMGTMPGLTTNDEFAEWRTRDPLRVVLGTPPHDQADKVRFQHYKAERAHVPAFFDLREALSCALGRIGEGAERGAGERAVPLHVYRTRSFQAWIANLRLAGNRLEDARLEWTLRPSTRRDVALFWIAWVRVWLKGEQRHKTEKVIARPDLCAVLAFCRGKTAGSTRVVLIREFRAPVNNSQGDVLELPSGSNFSASFDPLEVAASELREETGLDLEAARFVPVDSRQVAAPFSTHRAHLARVELTCAEMDAAAAKEAQGYAFGDGHGDEQTQVVVRDVDTLLEGRPGDPPVDWNTLGLILAGMASAPQV